MCLVAEFPALAFPSSSKATRSAPPDSAASSSGATGGDATAPVGGYTLVSALAPFAPIHWALEFHAATLSPILGNHTCIQCPMSRRPCPLKQQPSTMSLPIMPCMSVTQRGFVLGICSVSGACTSFQ
eukprot:1822652-Amphidinium_carterae.1